MQHIIASENQLPVHQGIRKGDLNADILIADVPLGPELVAEGLPTDIRMS